MCNLLLPSPPLPSPPQSTAHLLHGILNAQITPTFHKVNVHAAMTPGDIKKHFEPVFSQARVLQEAYQQRDGSRSVASSSTRVPFVTVSSHLSVPTIKLKLRSDLGTGAARCCS